MKNIVFAAVAAASLAGLAAPASAQTASPISYYGNLGYSYVDGGSAAQFSAAQARLGLRYGKYFGAEAEGAIGFDGDSATVGGVNIDTKLKRSFAGYAVGFYPVTPQLDLLARIGYGSTRISAKSATTRVSATEESVNYGGGGQWSFDANNALRAEYTRYDFNHNTPGADVWSVSYVRKF